MLQYASNTSSMPQDMFTAPQKYSVTETESASEQADDCDSETQISQNEEEIV